MSHYNDSMTIRATNQDSRSRSTATGVASSLIRGKMQLIVPFRLLVLFNPQSRGVFDIFSTPSMAQIFEHSGLA